jgi:predicted dehydrogenase
MSGLRVAIVGCGLVGLKRAAALSHDDHLLACQDVDRQAGDRLAQRFGCERCETLEELLGLSPDVVVVATTHDQLAGVAELALSAGAHVLLEKPAGISVAQVDALIESARASARLVKVGFNHRF